MNPRSWEEWCAYRRDLPAPQAQGLDLKKSFVVNVVGSSSTW